MTLSRQLADLTSGGSTTLATLDDIGDVNLTGLEDGKVIYRDGDDNLWKSAWANPKDPVADLRDFMDARYGAGMWTGRTGVGTGSDIGPAIDDACDAIRARYGSGEVRIVPNLWLMTTPPTPAKLSGNTIAGVGPSHRSNIVFNNPSGIMFHWNGAGGFTNGGIKNLTLFCESNFGLSTATAILLQGDATHQPDQFMIENIYCTSLHSSAYWYNGLLLNGTNRSAPQGLRVGCVENYQQFNCRNFAFGFFNLVQWSMSNIGSYTGTGLGNNIYIGGGGTTLTNTTQLDIDGMICSGELNLSNANRINIQGSANTISAATSFNNYWLDIDHGGFSGALGPDGYTRFL